MGNRTLLGRLRIRSMGCWLEDFEKLPCHHCRANEHAPQGKVDFKCDVHLIAPSLSAFLIRQHYDETIMIRAWVCSS
jgi:hypothetical protein